MNPSMKQKQNQDIENRLLVVQVSGVGEGWIGSLGLEDENRYK